MRRTIVTMVLAVAIGLTLTAVPAHAASVPAVGAKADSTGTWTPLKKGADLAALEAAAKAAYAKHPPPKTGPDASVSIGAFTFLLSLSHQDVGTLVGKIVGGVAIAEYTYLCTFLPYWIATAACFAAVAIGAAIYNQDLINAWNKVTWVADLGCGWSWTCSTPGAFPWWVGNTLLGWVMPVRWTGLNILFTWLCVPIAFEYT